MFSTYLKVHHLDMLQLVSDIADISSNFRETYLLLALKENMNIAQKDVVVLKGIQAYNSWHGCSS